MRVALGRIAEPEDDELAYAYYAANETARPYDRRRCSRDYTRRALAILRARHVEHGIAMIFKSTGLTANSPLARADARLARATLRRCAARLAKIAT